MKSCTPLQESYFLKQRPGRVFKTHNEDESSSLLQKEMYVWVQEIFAWNSRFDFVTCIFAIKKALEKWKKCRFLEGKHQNIKIWKCAENQIKHKCTAIFWIRIFFLLKGDDNLWYWATLINIKVARALTKKIYDNFIKAACGIRQTCKNRFL